MSLDEMLNSSGPQYERFGFEQAAMTINCLRLARINDASLLAKLQQFILIREGQLDKAKTYDIAMFVYGFGLLEYGSEALWSTLTS